MTLWINGAFGVGKTTLANHIVAARSDVLLFDPEEVGGLLQKHLHKSNPKEDFQDYLAWQNLVPEVARALQHETGKHLIVPMTVWREDYWKSLRNAWPDPNLIAVCLMASPETILKRLIARGEDPEGWAAQRIRRCVEAFSSGSFGERIDSENQTPEAIASDLFRRLAEFLG